MANNKIVRHPIILEEEQKPKRETKDTRTQSLYKLQNLRLDIQLQQNKPALLFVKERRDFIPMLVEVCKCYPYFVEVRYKCYDPYGNFRQYLYKGVSYVELYIGESKLKFFDEDI